MIISLLINCSAIGRETLRIQKMLHQHKLAKQVARLFQFLIFFYVFFSLNASTPNSVSSPSSTNSSNSNSSNSPPQNNSGESLILLLQLIVQTKFRLQHHQRLLIELMLDRTTLRRVSVSTLYNRQS